MATIYGTNWNDVGELDLEDAYDEGYAHQNKGDLRGTSTADAIHGLWGDDSLFGGAGRDFLYGDQGNDTMDGGAGPDVLDGGDGFDLADYSESFSPLRADLRTGIVTFPGQSWPNETLTSIEAIDGGSERDGFVGNGAANLFFGEGGSDTLIGNIGADTLVGGMGADSLDGGNGGDSLVGGLGDDTMLGGIGDDIFAIGPIDRLADPNTLVLVDFGKDVIDGGAGTDTLFVDGPAVYVPDISGNPYWPLVSAPPVRANLGLGTLRIGDSDNRSVLVSIENIETGSGNDSINGSTGDNFIQAGDGANVVYALGGDDTIVGGSTVFYGFDYRIDEVELLNGGPGDDVIYGSGSLVFLDVPKYDYTGTDILVGGGGDDTLYGGPAFQTMSGGSGRDVFVLTDEVLHQDMSFGEYATTKITDFEHSKDTIHFDFTNGDNPTKFVGAVKDDGDLQNGEVGYYRSGGDTVIEVMVNVDSENSLTVTLSNYTGPLSASDFDLA